MSFRNGYARGGGEHEQFNDLRPPNRSRDHLCIHTTQVSYFTGARDLKFD